MDPLEQKDVAAENPQVVRQLATQWQEWASENHARVGANLLTMERLKADLQPVPSEEQVKMDRQNKKARRKAAKERAKMLEAQKAKP